MIHCVLRFDPPTQGSSQPQWISSLGYEHFHTKPLIHGLQFWGPKGGIWKSSTNDLQNIREHEELMFYVQNTIYKF